MAGAGIHIDMSGLQGLQRKLEELGGFDPRQLLDVIGSTVESQTRRRISEEKTAPDGQTWPEWSSGYAAGRHAGNSMLEGDGDLLDSISYLVGSNEVEIGSNLIYAGIHQFGSGDEAVKVPAHKRIVRQAFGKALPFPVWANVGDYSFVQNIPAREYLGTSVDDEFEIRQVINDWFQEILS